MVDKPLVMGIINTTPDSFYAGSRKEDTGQIVQQAGQMLEDGAAIIDVGGQSTRPGSELLPAADELQRVIPAIEAIHRQFPSAIISVDTFYGHVAREAVAAGASIVNDISAGSMDDAMIPAIASLQVPYVLMHMKGTPQTMQQQAAYENVTASVLDFFTAKMDLLYKEGVSDIIIDPGFGFGKTIVHNLALLKDLPVFKALNAPLLLGVSRKSFIWKSLGITAEEALNGTTVMNTIGLINGASILRVHDVKEAVQAVKLYSLLNN